MSSYSKKYELFPNHGHELQNPKVAQMKNVSKSLNFNSCRRYSTKNT